MDSVRQIIQCKNIQRKLMKGKTDFLYLDDWQWRSFEVKIKNIQKSIWQLKERYIWEINL